MMKRVCKKLGAILLSAVCFGALFAQAIPEKVKTSAATITQEDAATGEYYDAINNLRYGFNVAGDKPLYDGGLRKTAPILEPISEELYKYVVHETSTAGGFESKTTSSAQSMAEHLSEVIDIKTSARAFVATMDLNTLFKRDKTFTELYEERYDLYYATISKDQFYFQDAANYKEHLSEGFIKDYKAITGKEDAEIFLNKYGTHLLTGHRYGGYLTASNYQAAATKGFDISSDDTLETKITAHSKLAGASGSAFYENYEAIENLEEGRISTYKCNTYGGSYVPAAMTIDHLFTYHQAIGGDSSCNYEYARWQQSIGNGNWVILGVGDYGESIPVWDLLPTTPDYNETRWALMDAYKEICGDKYAKFCEMYPNTRREIGASKDVGVSPIDGFTEENNGYANYQKLDEDGNPNEVTKGSKLYFKLKADSVPAEKKAWRIVSGTTNAEVVDVKNGIIKVLDTAQRDSEFVVAVFSGDVRVATERFVVKDSNFSGGSGEKDDPFLIATAEDLTNMLSKSDLYGSNYKLVADIDMKEYCAENKMPAIGSKDNPFSGVFDGNYYTISNVTLDDTPTDYAIGLFGYNAGTIKNLRLKNVSATFDNIEEEVAYAGGLVAYNAGTVENCSIDSVTLNINSDPTEDTKTLSAGGLIGFSTTSAAGGTSNVSLSKANNVDLYVLNDNGKKWMIYCYAGGLIGCIENTTVENCYMEHATQVYAGAWGDDAESRAAGLIGQVRAGGAVNYCVAGESEILNATGKTDGNKLDWEQNTFIGEVDEGGAVNDGCYAKKKTGFSACGTATIKELDNVTGTACAKLSGDIWYKTSSALDLYKHMVDKDLSIEVEEDATIYYHGESFMINGLTVKATFANGKGPDPEVLSFYKVDYSAFDNQYKGVSENNTYKIIITAAGGATASYDVTVRPIEVVGLKVTDKGNAKWAGDDPTLEDFDVEYILEDGTMTTIPASNEEKLPYVKYPTQGLTITSGEYVFGENEVTIMCGLIKGSVVITAEELELKQISVQNGPRKEKYKSGEKFSTAGMSVVAVYDDGTPEGRLVTISNADLEILGEEICYTNEGTYTITLIYDDYQTCTVTVSVEPSADDHECVFVEWTTIVAATCTTGGEETSTCTICGITQTRPTDVKGHTEGEWTTNVEATCTVGGKEVLTCVDCGATVDTKNTAAKGHTEGEWTTSIEATCTEDGEEIITCTVCNETLDTNVILAKGHTESDWTTRLDATCTEDGEEIITCTVCGETLDTNVIPAKGHTEGEWTTNVEATCTVGGKEVLTCVDCGVTLETRETAAKGHTEGEWTTNVEAACTKNGQEIITCTVCNEMLDTNVILAKGHTESEWIVDQPATETMVGMQHKECVDCGAFIRSELIPAKGHTAGEWTTKLDATCTEDGEEIITCTVCGDTLDTKVVPAKGHTEGEWTTSIEATCTQAGEESCVCTVCGTTLTRPTDVKGHTEGKWTTNVEATCTDTGEEIITCTVCNETLDTKLIPANGHTEGKWTTNVQPTCTEEGQDILTCKICGETLDTKVIPAKGHTEGEWTTSIETTCTKNGQEIITCVDCGVTLETRETAAKGHTAGEWTTNVEPTCTKDGEEIITCTVCGDTLDTNVILAKGHTEGEWTTNVEATCTQAGEESCVCTVCGTTLTRPTEAKGHTEGKWTTRLDATCTEDGQDILTCTVCGETLDTKVIPAKGHTEGKWTTSIEATCTVGGKEVLTCVDCGVTLETRETAAKGHTEGEWTTRLDATCTEDGEEIITCTVCNETLDTKVIPATGTSEKPEPSVSEEPEIPVTSESTESEAPENSATSEKSKKSGCGCGSVVSVTSLPAILLGASVCVLMKKRRQ